MTGRLIEASDADGNPLTREGRTFTATRKKVVPWLRGHMQKLVLDFYHASGYLHAAAGLLEVLDARLLSRRALSSADREAVEKAATCFRNNIDRMDYAGYRAAGLPIRSDPAWEAFCHVRVLTFCVMQNHFHILVQVPVRPDGFDPDVDTVLAPWEVAVGPDAREQLPHMFKVFRSNDSKYTIEDWRKRDRAEPGRLRWNQCTWLVKNSGLADARGFGIMGEWFNVSSFPPSQRCSWFPALPPAVTS